MKDVFILATHRSLVQKAESLIAGGGLERIDVVFCKTVKEILAFVTEDLPGTAEVLLTMPGPALLVEGVLQDRIPILSIEYNNIDIIRGLCGALSVCPGSVALGHYKEENPRIGDIREMVGRPFMNFLFGDDDNANRNILRQVKEQGVTAVVGGGYICNIAQEMGLSVFPLEVNLATLRKTIRNALSIADTRRFARYSRRNTDMILKYQAEAVMTVNSENRVTFFNKSAEHIFGMAGETALGKLSTQVLPDNRFAEVLADRSPVENFLHALPHMDILGDYRPVLDNGIVIGAVGTFSPMTEIQKKEELVRKYYTPKNAGPRFSFDDFQGDTPRFRALLDKARCFALTDETVLITGESGTGKEVMASSIHNASRRHDKPFLAINCASIPATLMESELFGYEPGAFTGGRKNGAPGMFESAHGGTLFLDEIGEMPFELQAKLLRVIQERRVRRIGSSRELPVDVRIVAATNKILEHEVAQHRFRVDLYYRLNILHIHMLPLRDYADNISDIAGNMLSRLAPESSYADQKHLRNLLKKLNSYDWPGNMRELENMVRRYAALSPYLRRPVSLGDIFTRPDLQEKTIGSVSSRKDQELQRIREAFDRLHGNRTQIARELGISRSTLWRKLKMLH
ncbi:sigma 54-interacting transcriptional regulator [Mailhella massiliensis]|uniref:sigma 54-interacting transcriptional regulator n=1 Tax=Mailhella massiliensis TaxID=1903261 RepID=UPI00097D0CAF|nr:sigma 54-interacting transcriptional regulator [Mailhella massiliensis]